MVGSLSCFEKFPAIITNYSAIQVLIIHVYLTHLKCKQVITGCINKIAKECVFLHQKKRLFQTFLNDKMGEEESPVLVRKRSCIKRGERKKSECSSA